jgi:hypothetical protein
MNNLYCHRPTPLTTYSLADLIGEPAVQYDEADYMRGPARLEAARQAEAFEPVFFRETQRRWARERLRQIALKDAQNAVNPSRYIAGIQVAIARQNWGRDPRTVAAAAAEEATPAWERWTKWKAGWKGSEDAMANDVSLRTQWQAAVHYRESLDQWRGGGL